MFKKIFGKDKKKPPPSAVAPQDLFRIRGDERAQKSDYNGAVAMYDEALNYTPTDTTLLLSRSFAHMMSTPPRLELALKDADIAIQLNPMSWQGWMQKGEVCSKIGDIKGAEEALTNAVGFSQGMDRFTAQKSLEDVKSRQRLTPSMAESSGTSKSTPATPLPETSINTPQSTPSNISREPPVTNQIRVPPSSMSSAPRSSAQNPPLPHTINSTQTNSSTASSVLPTVLTSGETSQNTSAQARQPASGSQAPISSPGTGDPPPPNYTPNLTNPNPTVRALSQQAVMTQLTQLETTLAAQNKGSISIRPYTLTGSIDAVKLVYVGMTILELTARELNIPTYQHPSFKAIAVDAVNFPGSTFLDMDCESSGYYDGKIPGTTSISGYSEEYRTQQLLRSPLLNLILEGNTALPTMTTENIVNRIRLLQRQPTLEDDQTLSDILGLSQLATLQSGFLSGNRQRKIEAICMGLNRSLYDAPTRFIDFSKARNFSNNTLGSATQGIGLQNFLFQIMIGAELLIRLRKEPITTSYAGLISDATSALVVLSAIWMENVTIQGPKPPPTTSAATDSPGPRYVLVADENQRQVEGLIRFGEALSWPYMDEARNYIENAYNDLITGKQLVGFDICDWLFGLILPGKIFRHRIMACLVYASPSVRSLGAPPLWSNGLVVGNKSYWPKRTVLGRVLGGLKNPKSICGWIGPVPAPEEGPSGWILISARSVDIPTPVSATQTSLQSLGFEDGTESPEVIIQSIMDPSEWIQTSPPPRPTSDSSHSVFKGIHLTEVPSTNTTVSADRSKECRASLDFEINGTSIRYTLYSNPIFINAPPCVGTHTMLRRQAQTYLSHIIKVVDLKEASAPTDTLVIIDALGQGEEVVARAWCAERARHAVIRRGEGCCFGCATTVVAARTGLGFNVLIWSR